MGVNARGLSIASGLVGIGREAGSAGVSLSQRRCSSDRGVGLSA